MLKDSSGNGYHGQIIAAKWINADGTEISAPIQPQNPAPDVEREAALAIGPHANLGLKLSTGEEIRSQRGQALPAGSFEILSIFDIKNTLDREVFFQHVARLGNLRRIGDWFNYLNWTTADLNCLAKFPCAKTLSQLQIVGKGFDLSGEMVTALKQFPVLDDLDIGIPTADDAMLEQLARDLPGLRLLTLLSVGEKVTGKGFTAVTKLPLRVLRTTPQNMDRTWLAAIAKMPDLQRLILSYSNVNDEMLPELARCQNLKYLELKNTKVTETGVKKLGLALPNCQIVWDGGMINP